MAEIKTSTIKPICLASFPEVYSLGSPYSEEGRTSFSESSERSRDFSESPTNFSEAYSRSLDLSEGVTNFSESYSYTN